MRKVLIYLLITAVCIGLCACGQTGEQTGPTAMPEVKFDSPVEIFEEPVTEATPGADNSIYTEILIYIDKDGTHVEKYFFGEKVGKLIQNNPNTGIYTLYEIYPSGNAKRQVEKNSQNGWYWEEEMFESGAPKRQVQNDPETGMYTELELYETGNAKRGVQMDSNTGEYYIEERYESGAVKLQGWNDLEAGTYTEREYRENGTWKRSLEKNLQTGAYTEQEFSENGHGGKTVSFDPATGIRTETESYDNGSYKRLFEETPERTCEQKFTESGQCTYYYEKTADRELELVGDENGKLVKCTENGEVKEDPTYLSEIATNYGFSKS